MLDMFIFETTQNIEQLEKSILSSEKSSCYTPDAINEIFRIMHTIKGSSAMMLFNNIASLAHAMEDLFYFIREEKLENMDCAILSDLLLEGVDFIKVELEKVENADSLDGDASNLIENIEEFLSILKLIRNHPDASDRMEEISMVQQYYLSHSKETGISNRKGYKAIVRFEEGCEMENIRAYTIVHNLREITEEFFYTPVDIIENDDSVQMIREQGFEVILKSEKSFQELHDFFMQTVFLKNLELIELEDDQTFERLAAPKRIAVEESPIKVPKLQVQEQADKEQGEREKGQGEGHTAHQSIISVHVAKLDKLMDLMGEMVIAEAMVTQNPDLQGLELDNFQKAARQLRKITGEMQDMVMSIRMVPLSATFQKMHRIVRDMSKKLGKEVELKLIGEETEVDKNIIEHISDPLMHLVRNSIDHGIEAAEDRAANGKSKAGMVTLEAKNAGSDVLVIVRDDGKGLNKEKILQKAKENGLILKPESEMIDREIYNIISLPGFSTKDQVTEFSGRGVGMDVVTKNLEAVGGSISVDSTEGAGTTTTLKIPLTLAIIDGMNIRVGASRYTLPTISIMESFRPKESDIIRDPDGNEMIMVRGQCYPILCLHELYGVNTEVTTFTEGILIMVEQDGKSLCLFADELLGQQQVVVKALPTYIKNTRKIEGLAGCTLLGDGSISLILDIGGLISIGNSI
jgi:two-component system chemotaxis sensor kinase CheA